MSLWVVVHVTVERFQLQYCAGHVRCEVIQLSHFIQSHPSLYLYPPYPLPPPLSLYLFPLSPLPPTPTPLSLSISTPPPPSPSASLLQLLGVCVMIVGAWAKVSTNHTHAVYYA